jgi:phenylacetate-CoA ligase
MELKSYKKFMLHLVRGLPLFVRMNFGNYNRIANRRLRYLVKYAYENVPLYRRKYDAAGVKPEDIHGMEDLGKLPLITKQDLVSGYPDDIIARGLKPQDYYLMGTSGSTGAPLRIFKSRDLLSSLVFSTFFMGKLVGYFIKKHLKDNVMFIFVDVPDSLEGVTMNEIRSMSGYFSRRNPHLDATSTPQQHVAGLNYYQPEIVFTYPSVLRNIACYVEQYHILLHQPKLLVVSGELMDQNTRKVITRVFSGELLNFYMATECGLMATECEHHKGLHLRGNSVILEILKNGKPVPEGTTGEVVVTDLWNQATPIIRYTGLGDSAAFSLESCHCRQKSRLLKMVAGRQTDSIILRDGSLLHPFSLTLALEHIAGIARFQIIQEDYERVKVLLVGADGDLPHLAQQVKDSLDAVFMGGADVSVEFVDEIPGSGNGNRVVVSRVARAAV